MRKEKIIISCDTTVALSKEDIAKLNYNVIPLNAIADGIEYHDTVDIDANRLSQMMRNGAKVSTSTPTIGEIESFFDNIFEKTKADVIIHFTISSKLSSMFSLFTTVCNERYGDKVIVVDSMSICCFIENQIRYATHLVETTDLSAKEIAEKVTADLVKTEGIVFIPDSLEYLKRGGRISPAVAAIAGFIGVIPVLTFGDGVVGKKGVTRTAQKAMATAYKEWEENIANFESDYELVFLYSDEVVKEKADKLISYIHEFVTKREISLFKISLNVIAHTGPGTFGFGYRKKVKM